MAKETFWFRHDYDAADDDKTMLLIEQLGLEGYGIYWVLIEKLRGREGYKMPFSVIPSLARRYMTTPEKMKTVIMQYGLFTYDEEGFFYSESLINRMKSLNALKEKRAAAGRIGMKKRWQSEGLEYQPDNENLEQSEDVNCDNKNITLLFQSNNTDITTYNDKNRIDKNREEEKIEKEKEDNKLSSKKRKFDFFAALLDLGIDETVARDWLAVRKTKKMTNTETAFVRLKNQVKLSGCDANHCISIAVEHSWGGFMAEWLKNVDTTQYEQQYVDKTSNWETI